MLGCQKFPVDTVFCKLFLFLKKTVLPPVGLSNWCRRLTVRIARSKLPRPLSARPTGTQGSLADEPDSPRDARSRGPCEHRALTSPSLRTLFTKRREADGVSRETKVATAPNATFANFLHPGLLLVFVVSTGTLFAQEKANVPETTTQVKFLVTLAKMEGPLPTQGRVLVFVSKTNSPRLVAGPNWFQPEPFFAFDANMISPEVPVTVGDTATSFPAPPSSLKPGKYFCQAILDQDFFHSSASDGPGNVYSLTKEIEIVQGSSNTIELTLDQIVKEDAFEDTETMKFIDVESPRLTAFHHRRVTSPAAVILPASYGTDTTRRYPVYYEITGFGGTLNGIARGGRRRASAAESDDKKVDFIRVVLTGQCKWGHHVYANSDTNGPRGDALIEELIPYVDQNFRTIADSRARFVGGHSSGGWSSLWLQVAYPDSFGGVWSTSPDPVDFRDFQQTNLYLPDDSVFVDRSGDRRPLARRGAEPVVWYDSFSKMDDVIGRGGQLRSFEAVFSRVGSDGQPEQCWDRTTGAVNPATVEAWKRYDISLILKQRWESLGPKLTGKLHVYMGDLDTFYLEGATKLLGERLKELGSDAVVELVPGKDHGSLLDGVMRRRINREMSDAFLKQYPDWN
jgi:S-formylglutathione hydrolase FrmB